MPEPTIDELLEWVDSRDEMSAMDYSRGAAVRAILVERHEFQRSGASLVLREVLEQYKEKKHVELEAIRAFVERVEKRIVDTPDDFVWLQAVKDEVAALEGEADAGSND